MNQWLVVEMPLQIFLQTAGRRIAIRRLHGQAAVDDGRQSWGHRGVETANPLSRLATVGDHVRNNVVAQTVVKRIGQTSCQHLEQDHSQRIDIAGRSHRAAGTQSDQVLRRHIGKCSADQGHGRFRFRPARGQIEVEDQRLAVIGEQNIGRLEIAMHDSMLVRTSHAIGDPRHDPDGGVQIAHVADPPDGLSGSRDTLGNRVFAPCGSSHAIHRRRAYRGGGARGQRADNRSAGNRQRT